MGSITLYLASSPGELGICDYSATRNMGSAAATVDRVTQ
jgi:hypothetical protein